MSAVQERFDFRPPGFLAGVDEAGRGPLAGPVVAAAVVLDPKRPITGLKDSKLLSEKKRSLLAKEIRQQALAWAIASANETEIDDINILEATMLAMSRAVDGLSILPKVVLVDGNRCPRLTGRLATIHIDAIIGGDGTEPAISAASILAKVHRDAEMDKFHQMFPEYGFADHKGYATAKHLCCIDKYGPCAIHRRSFSPIKDLRESPSDGPVAADDCSDGQ